MSRVRNEGSWRIRRSTSPGRRQASRHSRAPAPRRPGRARRPGVGSTSNSPSSTTKRYSGGSPARITSSPADTLCGTPAWRSQRASSATVSFATVGMLNTAVPPEPLPAEDAPAEKVDDLKRELILGRVSPGVNQFFRKTRRPAALGLSDPGRVPSGCPRRAARVSFSRLAVARTAPKDKCFDDWPPPALRRRRPRGGADLRRGAAGAGDRRGGRAGGRGVGGADGRPVPRQPLAAHRRAGGGPRPLVPGAHLHRAGAPPPPRPVGALGGAGPRRAAAGHLEEVAPVP